MDVLRRIRYGERTGFGTTQITRQCRAASLPEPEFRQEGGAFVVRLWRDWLTEGFIDGLAVSERQRRAVHHVNTERSTIGPIAPSWAHPTAAPLAN